MTLTPRAATLVAGGQPPATARDVVRRAVLDTVAVALAGRDEPVVRRVEEYTGLAAWAGSGEAAALVNGTAAHALDYDDNSDLLKGHPSAVLVPALLAIGEEPDEIADAYAVGFQIACALAAGVGLAQHYARGWHATSTLMTVAAAAAVARLEAFDEQRAGHAIALGTSMASGPREQFGTEAKPLHAGLAASNAVRAAKLAGAGVTGSGTALEGPHGFLAVFGEPADVAAAEAVLDGPWLLDRTAINIKRHPCCGALQRTADAALALAGRVNEVDRIRVTIEPGGSMPLRDHAETGTEARFSARYVAAAALIDGRLELASFSDASVQRPAVRALMERVELVEAPTPPVGPPEWRSGYAVVEAGGDAERVDAPLGHGLNPLDDDLLAEKVRACAGDDFSLATAATPAAASR